MSSAVLVRVHDPDGVDKADKGRLELLSVLTASSVPWWITAYCTLIPTVNSQQPFPGRISPASDFYTLSLTKKKTEQGIHDLILVLNVVSGNF